MRRHRARSRWRRILTWATVAVLTPTLIGVVTAVIYVSSVRLPDDPVTVQASTLYYRDGRTILARVGTENHTDVPISSVPDGVRHAVIAAEDRDFYSHPGVSVKGVLRSIVADLRGRKEGASTITQQYARNAFLTQEVSFSRKTREMALAIKLEQKYSKDQILERYLNTIYFGRQAYGIAAAAHAYFGVTPDRLDPAQGAVLASVIKDPYRYDPANDATAARQRWTWVVNAERDAGWLAATPAYPKVLPSSATGLGPNGIVVDRVEQELAQHGVSSQVLHTKGLSVVTTLDAAAQQAAIRQVSAHLSGQPKDLRAALVGLDPTSGAVRAYYGGGQSGFFDDAKAIHPAASTFKPIVLGAAVERGLSPLSIWNGSSPRIFPGRLGVPLKNHDNVQCPRCTLVQAMIDSLNTPFYAVTEVLGANTIRTLAYNLGISTSYDNKPSLVDVKGDPAPGTTRPDISIGRYAVSPGDLASVYATFAGNGVEHNRYFVQSVSSGRGTKLWSAVTTSRKALDPYTAAVIARVLQLVVRADNIDPGRPAAAKTGTQAWGDSNDNQDAWLAGFTPELATSVWVGKAKPGPIKDKNGKAIEGETMPAAIWRDFTHDALAGRPVQQFPEAQFRPGRLDADPSLSVPETADQPPQLGDKAAAARAAAKKAADEQSKLKDESRTPPPKPSPSSSA